MNSKFYYNQYAANAFKSDAEGLCKHLNNLNTEFKKLGYGEIKAVSDIVPAIASTHNYIAERALKNAGLKPGNFELTNAFNVIRKPYNYEKIMEISEIGHFQGRYQYCSSFVMYKSDSWVLSDKFEKETEHMFWVHFRDEKQKSKITALRKMIDAFNEYSVIENRFDRDNWDTLKFYVNNGQKGFVLDNEAATGI